MSAMIRLLCPALALALSACAPKVVGLAADPVAARGHAVAQSRCAGCHAVEPGQESPHAAAPPFASLEMRHTAGLDNRVATLTRLGHYGMPPLKLRPDEVRDLVRYIAELDGR